MNFKELVMRSNLQKLRNILSENHEKVIGSRPEHARSKIYLSAAGWNM